MSNANSTEPPDANADLAVGILIDRSTSGESNPTLNCIRGRIADLNAASGVNGRRVDLRVEIAPGYPEFTPAQTVAGFQRLVAQDVLMVAGSGISHNTLEVFPAAEAAGMPLLQWSGSPGARGKWTFHYQAGSMPDEPAFITRWLAACSYRQVGLVRDGGPVGDQYHAAFQIAASADGIATLVDQPAEVDRESLKQGLLAMRSAGCQALVWLGFGPSSFVVAELLREIEWSPPAIGNIGLGRMGAVYQGVSETPPGEGLDGWLRTDMVDVDNPVLQEMEAWYRPRFGPPPVTFQAAFGWDIANLVIEALRRAPEYSRDGLRLGLEAIRDLAACCGGAGTTMRFGPDDHGALHGSNLFVLREIWDHSLRPYRGLAPPAPQ